MAPQKDSISEVLNCNSSPLPSIMNTRKNAQDVYSFKITSRPKIKINLLDNTLPSQQRALENELSSTFAVYQ